MSAPSADAESRENSPEGHEDSAERRTSKKRKVLSCFACRNRKMKCDRVYPVCGRCQKTGRADQCTYDPRLLEDQTPSGVVRADGTNALPTLPGRGFMENDNVDTSSEDMRWRLRTQEGKIQMLEKKLKTRELARSSTQYGDVRPEEPRFKEETMFRGKGFKTQFHGTTSVMSMIAQYRELQNFTREALAMDHSMSRIKTEFKTFRERRKILTKEKMARTHGTDDEVFAALPDKETVDVHVALYFHTWETTYRILHEPSFWKEYYEFWKRGVGDEKGAGFATILILMVAATKCVGAKDDVFVGDSTADRDSASSLIETCDAWLSRQPRKRLTLRYFQLQCLALLAKRANCVKLKQDWLTSGDVMRLALSAGMHRDPSSLGSGRISEYEKEMKKRLWFTIAELELQSSIDNGLQSSLTSLYFDTPVPANLPDEAFSLETPQMPEGRASDQFTPASYLIVAARSLPLRIHLTQLLNDPSTELQYSDVLHYDAQIHAILSALPFWAESRAMLASALLDLQLRQYLLILHKPYAGEALHNRRFVYSLTACVDAASSIVSTHDSLISKNCLALNNFRNDTIRVCMALSRLVYLNCARLDIPNPAPPQPQHETHFADATIHIADAPFKEGWATPNAPLALTILPREPFTIRTLCSAGIDLIDHAGQIFENKVMRLGTGYMEFWLLSAAIGILPPPSDALPPPRPTSIAHITTASDDVRSRCKKALDRMSTLSFRILAMQKDPGSNFASSLWNTMSNPSQSDARTPSTNSTAAGKAGAMGATPGTVQDAPFRASSGMELEVDVAKGHVDGGLEGAAFDALRPISLDAASWNFPEFWSFDLAGEF